MSTSISATEPSRPQVDHSTTVTFTSVSLILLTAFIAFTSIRMLPLPPDSKFRSAELALGKVNPAFSERVLHVESMLRKTFPVIHRQEISQGVRFEINIPQTTSFISESDRLSAQYLAALAQVYTAVTYAKSSLDISFPASPHFLQLRHSQLLTILRFLEDLGLPSQNISVRQKLQEVELMSEINISFVVRPGDYGK